MNRKNYSLVLSKIDWNGVIPVVIISLLAALTVLIPVIFGYLKAPQGIEYQWTGHYYLDYFYYLQFIAQGLRGYWLPRQYSATDDPSIYFHLEPYVIIGNLGRLLGLTPISTYWISVFILVFILALLIFLAIRRTLNEKSFKLQLAAFLIALSSGPLFKLVTDSSNLKINFFDYWASYGSFFKRFEPVPHHLLAHIFVLIIFLLSHKFISNEKKNLKSTLRFILLVSLILSAILSFYPFHALTAFFAVALTALVYFIKKIFSKEYDEAIFLLFYILIIGLLVFIMGLIINKYYYQTVFFQSTKGVEVGWRRFPDIKDVLLNLGPVIIVFLFGIRNFFRKINSLGIILIFFALISFGLYYSSLDLKLNTHNGRFLTPLNYIFLASVGVLGMKKISEYLSFSNKRVTFIVLTVLLTLISLPGNIMAFYEKLNDKNLNSSISYLPKTIIEGFKQLDKQLEKGNVLMTPSQFLGTVVPVYTDRKTYVARHAATPDYLSKNIRTGNFYLGAMTNEEAKEFLEKNNLKFVVLTSVEGYDVNKLYSYPFLQEIYKNKDIVIFRVKS